MPMLPKHIFHHVLTFEALPHGTYNSDKSDAPVLDLRDFPKGAAAGFLVLVTGQTTLDENNHFLVELWEADGKASATALDGTAKKVDATDRVGHDVSGLTADNVLLDGTTMSTYPLPKLNAAAQVGTIYWFVYRGYRPCLQLRLDAAGSGGNPDASIVAIGMVYTDETVNTKASVVN